MVPAFGDTAKAWMLSRGRHAWVEEVGRGTGLVSLLTKRSRVKEYVSGQNTQGFEGLGDRVKLGGLSAPAVAPVEVGGEDDPGELMIEVDDEKSEDL